MGQGGEIQNQLPSELPPKVHMRKPALVSFLTLFLAVGAFGKDYKAGLLLSWENASSGEKCDSAPGIVGTKTDCYAKGVKFYRVRIENLVYKLRADTPIDIDDPLAALQPDQEFKYRFDAKGHIWIPAPINKGRYHKPDHEAKYIVERVEKAP